MSNGRIPLSGTNLSFPASGADYVLKEVKIAIKEVPKKGLESIFNSNYALYPQFQNLKITTEYPIRNEDIPCVVIGLGNLKIKQSALDRRNRRYFVQISPTEWAVMREEKRSFEATLILYHASYSIAELGRLSNALMVAITFDPGDKLIRYTTENVPGIMYASDVLTFQGEQREPPPENGDRWYFSDVLRFPVIGEVVMRAFYGTVTAVELAYAVSGADSDILIQDYPSGWDW